MRQDRLFNVPPDVVTVTVSRDHLAGGWRVRVSSTVVRDNDEPVVEAVEVYNALVPAEALDVVLVEVGRRIGADGVSA